jgi:cytochrome c biogenesis protein CcdA
MVMFRPKKEKNRMLIVAVAWIYVVLLMALTETSVVAGIMTFLSYCVLPLSIIYYIFGRPKKPRAMPPPRPPAPDESE